LKKVIVTNSNEYLNVSAKELSPTCLSNWWTTQVTIRS